MKTLEQNIKSIYGSKGKAWLDDLHNIVNKLTHDWNLEDIRSVDNMTFHYVARALTKEGRQPVILKIGCDAKTIENEVRALSYFNGNGSVRMINHNEEYNALLLRQAIPGMSLRSLYQSQTEQVMDDYIETMHKLHQGHLTGKHHWSHIDTWLTAIDKLKFSDACLLTLIEKAVSLKTALLSSMTCEIVLHGDLHHDNILQNDDTWLAIDPKGIIGEPEFEIAAFDFMYIRELSDQPDAKMVLESRINLLAQKSGLNAERIKDWVFVRLMLMVAWHVEDNGDPSSAIKLAERLM